MDGASKLVNPSDFHPIHIRSDPPGALATAMVPCLVGDELTNQRFRGAKVYRAGDDNGLERLDFVNDVLGWFHVVMILAQEIWQVHAGSSTGTGLARNIALPQRIHFAARKGGGKDAKSAGPLMEKAKDSP